MDNNYQDTTGVNNHSQKRRNIVVAVVGVVGGSALFLGVMAWYFTRVDTAEFHQPKDGGIAKPVAKDSEDLLMDTDVIDIVPISEMRVKIKSGKAESVEVPKDSGLKANVDGDAVTISASKDAKEGTHQITVKGSKGKKATIRVNLKAANPVTLPKTNEHP